MNTAGAALVTSRHSLDNKAYVAYPSPARPLKGDAAAQTQHLTPPKRERLLTMYYARQKQAYPVPVKSKNLGGRVTEREWCRADSPHPNVVRLPAWWNFLLYIDHYRLLLSFEDTSRPFLQSCDRNSSASREDVVFLAVPATYRGREELWGWSIDISKAQRTKRFRIFGGPASK